MPGSIWVEITYLNSSDCFNSREYLLPSSNCSGTFIFVGDVISMARSIQLTMYQPRLNVPFATYLPDVLERILLCLFHASLALALLNSLPVSFFAHHWKLFSYLLHGDIIKQSFMIVELNQVLQY